MNHQPIMLCMAGAEEYKKRDGPGNPSLFSYFSNSFATSLNTSDRFIFKSAFASI